MTIKDIIIKEIFDSRGESTTEITVKSGNGAMASAQIPAGKSKGAREITTFNASESRKSALKIKKILNGKQIKSVAQLDEILIKADGTVQKEKLGGNVILGVSISFVKIIAQEKKILPWEVIKKEFFGKETKKAKPPLIFSNFINGGEHAQNSLDIQEYLVIARPQKPFVETVRELISLYEKLGKILREKFKIKEVPIGDEAGYSPSFSDNFNPIKILSELIKKIGKGKFSLGIDAAASSFYEGKGIYNFGGKKMTRQSLLKIYKTYFSLAPLFYSIEDPFAQDDKEGFFSAENQLKGKLIVGDDLTVSNPSLIKEAAAEKLINGVIIKPNQIGTVSESCAAISVAKNKGLKTIVSHRSGETKDAFIIHLAKAGSVDGVKIGAPARERMIKFNELIKLYE